MDLGVSATFNTVLRISQAVYELKAVGEQTRDLLNTTKYVNSSLKTVRDLRRKKSELLNRDEKEWIDLQTEFTQKAVDSVALLIERARVDMASKNNTGNEDNYETRYIKLHHRARFVLQDGPKVQTNLNNIILAMNGLNSAMVTLSSRGGQDVHLQPSRASVRRTRSTSPKQAPPPYTEGGFLNRRRNVGESVQKRRSSQKDGYLVPEDHKATLGFASQTVPYQPLHHHASMSSITPSLNFTSVSNDQYYEFATTEDMISPDSACLATSSIRDSIGSESYFELQEMDGTTSPRLNTHEMDASAHSTLQKWSSEPAVPTLTRAPTIPRKPVEYRQHRAGTRSVTSIHEDFDQTVSTNPWTSGTSRIHSPTPPPLNAQKNLPMLPLHPTGMASTASLNSTLSGPSTPSQSRGRAWLLEKSAGGNPLLSRTQSGTLPYPYHSPDEVGHTPGAWPR